jgi:hypothetical protein
MAYTTIDDPSAYFQTALYTGNGTSTNAITNDGNSDLQPDWLWLKARSILADHIIFDSTRGTNKRISTNTTSVEETQAFYSSFDTDGFTLGDSNANVNQNGTTYVNWQWKANGGTTASNTDGSITSTVQANTTAGFSIVTYDGTGSSGATFGHGLGTVPNFIIIKNRSEVKDWAVYHSANTSAPETDALFLNLTDATIDNTGYWNDTAPTSSIITVGDNTKVNSSGEQHIAYCFKEIQGYSKFGSYTGNGNADGSFVYTGFKPAWIMIKKTNNTSQWVLHDTTRQEFNMQTRFLQANQTAAESTSSAADLDILSNGFKLRSTDDAQNGNGDTFIYMAFAEHPFVSSKGVPTTAR